MALKDRLIQLYHGDFIRFCVVGGITAGVQLGLYYLLLIAHIYYETSSVISMIVSTFLAYVGNRLWTFHSIRGWLIEILEYSVTRFVTIIINGLILYELVESARLGEFFSQVVSVIVITVINYAIGKLVVFRKVSPSVPVHTHSSIDA